MKMKMTSKYAHINQAHPLTLPKTTGKLFFLISLAATGKKIQSVMMKEGSLKTSTVTKLN